MTSAPAFATLAQPFLDPTDIKVWSVLVTIIGDIAPEAAIGGPILTALIESMGLQPQAMRVALHRLKRDGWVESEKIGRVGFYRMSKAATSTTFAVSPRVYAPRVEPMTSARLVVGNPLETEPKDQGFPIAPNVVLLPPEQDVRDLLAATVEVDALPDWVISKIRESACFTDCTKLAADLVIFRQNFDPDALGLIDRTALRILVLHRWRRLALRMDPLAEAMSGADQPPALCRARVAECLELLERPTLQDLAEATGL